MPSKLYYTREPTIVPHCAAVSTGYAKRLMLIASQNVFLFLLWMDKILYHQLKTSVKLNEHLHWQQIIATNHVMIKCLYFQIALHIIIFFVFQWILPWFMWSILKVKYNSMVVQLLFYLMPEVFHIFVIEGKFLTLCIKIGIFQQE